MSAVWHHFRRLVASVMLVAVTSFVLHGGAMADLHRHGPGSECGTSAAGHIHKAAAHDHAAAAVHVHRDGHAHVHAKADHAKITVDYGPDKPPAAGKACCTSVCSVALTALAPDMVSAPSVTTAALLPVAQDGASTHLDGLKRPPRSPGIA